jgi:hypothetical protein
MPQPTEASAPMRHQRPHRLPAFLLGLAIVLGLAIAAKQLLLRHPIAGLEVGGDSDYLLTSDGPWHRTDQRTDGLMKILFPGYHSALEELAPPLYEESEYAIPTLKMSDGHLVRVLVPRTLPLSLLAKAPPDVLLLGTSRMREAARPDVIARKMNFGRVLNFSVSGASMETIELQLEEISRLVHGRKIPLLVIGIDDVSFDYRPANVDDWRSNIQDWERGRSVTGQLKERVETLLDHFPRLQKARWAPLGTATHCDREPEAADRRDVSLSHAQVDALKRVVGKADSIGEQVLYIVMPLTPSYYTANDMSYLPAARAILAERLIERPLADWGLNTASFQGAKGVSPCYIDHHHVSPAAAESFSAALVDLAQQSARNPK